MINKLTDKKKHDVFLRSVCSYQGAKNRWEKRVETGLSDEALKQSLKEELGIAGGSGCTNTISIAYQGSGLKIWASRTTPNHCMDAPILEGSQTMEMARLVFNIADPENLQTDLFWSAL